MLPQAGGYMHISCVLRRFSTFATSIPAIVQQGGKERRTNYSCRIHDVEACRLQSSKVNKTGKTRDRNFDDLEMVARMSKRNLIKSNKMNKTN